MKLIPQQPSLLYDEVKLDMTGPSMLEVRDAVSMLCLKYGAEVGLLIEADDRAREDVLAFCGSARPRDDMTIMVVAR